MNDSLPNICSSVREQLNHYLSAELATPARDEVSRHLSECSECAAEYESRLRLRASLKGAVQRSAVPPFLEARIRRSLVKPNHQKRSLWLWAPVVGTAAVLLLIFLSGRVGAPPDRPWEMAKTDQATFINALYGQVAEIMRIGLGDHLHCAYFRKFPDAPPTADALVAKIGPQYAPLLPVIREQAPAGHQVLLAHQCVFQDRSFIHVALEHQGKLVSLVITRKQPGESFRENSIGRDGNAGAIYQANAEQFAIAGFEAGEYLAFVVSDHGAQDNLQFAANLAAPVRRVLADVQG